MRSHKHCVECRCFKEVRRLSAGMISKHIYYFHNLSGFFAWKSGNLIASGQINHMGFRAYVIVWCWETKREISRHELHKVSTEWHSSLTHLLQRPYLQVHVQALCFTSNEKFLVSLGGRDDGSLVVWNLEKK